MARGLRCGRRGPRAGTVGVVAIVLLPWVLGGFDPTREDLTWAILIAFGTAFLSLVTLLLSVFDLAGSR
jgi:hypothetical protein